ncbi:MAG: carboxymuconolactone decarboxylase family protein [Pirellulales bacterium]
MTARIQPVEVASAEGRTQELFGQIQKRLGKVPNMMKTMAHSPALLEGYLALSNALAQGVLPAQVREQLSLAVSQENDCEYCVSAHSMLGKLAGLKPDQLVAARRGQADDEKTQALLSFALDVVDNRGDVSDEALEAVKDAGASDAEVAEIVGFVALNTLTNYFNQLAQTEIDFPRVSLQLESVA